MSLSKEQEEYVNSSGNIVLIACPGSGKTFSVAEKVKRIMKSWNRVHSGVAVLSFTNVAIDEIRRIVQKEQIIAYPHFFGTVDSFINEIFLRYAGIFCFHKRPRIIFDYIDISHPWQRECYANCIHNLSSIYWNMDFEVFKNNKKVSCQLDKNGLTLCNSYKRKLLKNGIVFQVDVPMLCTHIMKKHLDIAKAIVKRYPIIIIDEAQDTSKEQMEFFDLLCNCGLEALDMVGDPDQAIYEWRNATPEYFVGKIGESGWRKLNLTENRRSSQKICDATASFSDTLNGKTPNLAVGEYSSFYQTPQLFLLSDESKIEDASRLFLKKCDELRIMEKDIAVLTRGKVCVERDVNYVWKSREIELLAKAAYEFYYGSRKRAYALCEQAVFVMCIDDLEKQNLTLEQEVAEHLQYQEWRKKILTILCGLQSADVELETWVKSLKEFLLKCDFPLPLRKGHDIQSIIKIKSRDSKYSDFKKSPLKNFFQLKIVDSYVRSSIHGVKGETFDAVLLCATKCKGNTITRSLLCSGKLDSEMMRTAYVAMTRPRKYLAIAMIMPKRQMDLKERFPQTKWEYIYVK